ncbi:AP-1 complex-associated regulatory protein [Fukomys damarensis]|uniref:AP-1 complex-associated regulatory protein n=1 Tax=Fukomys damarensis TaxID=885580 RepID=A0A091D462_FUKDA|nr:AP-1 complex-associated regulatory protein [Fukomys damarensis]
MAFSESKSHGHYDLYNVHLKDCLTAEVVTALDREPKGHWAIAQQGLTTVQLYRDPCWPGEVCDGKEHTASTAPWPLTEEEIIDLRERHYDSLAEKQKDLDKKIQKELALQEEKLRLEEEALYAAQREAARAAKQRKLAEQGRQRVVHQYHPSGNGDHQSSGPEDDFESCMRNIKSQYEVFRSSRLSSDATVLTPNTESSCDLMTKTRSTSGNDDNTSLDLEWEDEEGMNRMLPMRERSKTEEDILRAALKSSSKKTGSNPTSASDDSNGLEWENDFVTAEMDDNGNSEYSGLVNPVLELSDAGRKQSDADQQIR